MTPTDPKPTPALLACPSAEPAFHHSVALSSIDRFEGNPEDPDAWYTIYWVECNCGVRGPERITEEQAVEAWGYIRRPPLPVEGAPAAGEVEGALTRIHKIESIGNDVVSIQDAKTVIAAYLDVSARLSALLNGKGEGALVNKYDRICAHCGFRFGRHAWKDNLCPLGENDTHEYRETSFEVIAPAAPVKGA